MISSLVLGIVLWVGAPRAEHPWVELKGEKFFVEIAQTPQARERGLMFRDRLGDREGMLFIWEKPQPLSFWMKNTPLSLDILFLNEKREVVSLFFETKPLSLDPLPSTQPAQYVLEVRGGVAKKLGVKKGDRLRFHIDSLR
jgi:uncharacterized membrane protein (UPF0127 family)